jgi:hypothetical protein
MGWLENVSGANTKRLFPAGKICYKSRGGTKEARETAIARLSKGIQEEIASQCTGVSLKEVRALRKV